MPITYGDLTPEDVERLGSELDVIRNRLKSELGQPDLDYIRKIIKTQRGLELAGRAMLEFAWMPPLMVGGVAALTVSKILDNMEIGHNVLHGQYDWTNDPALDSKTFEWDNACPAEQWRHSHNFMHHTYTNVLDMDRDIGYGLLRVTEEQRWSPYYLGNLVWATLLMLLFEWGVALHDLDIEEILKGNVELSDKKPMLKQIWRKGRRQALKDFVVFPLLAGRGAPSTLMGNFSASILRNIWTYSIIFCGHFPAGVQEFSKDDQAKETKGEWYLRQMLGSANITGGPLFHIMSGNLSFQIEHHLFPDIPARRYAAISTEVKDICERYGLPYNAGPMHKQLGSVFQKLLRMSSPLVGNSPLNRTWTSAQPAPAPISAEVVQAPELAPV